MAINKILFFTNDITIQDCALNGGEWNILDDGGNVHVFIGNNLNGAKHGAGYFAAVTGLMFTGQAYETGYGDNENNLRFGNYKWGTATYKGVCRGGTITGNTFSSADSDSAAMLSFQADGVDQYHSGFNVFGNYFTNFVICKTISLINNLINDLFRRYDESATDLNTYLAGQSNFIYHHAMIDRVFSPEPYNTEGDYQIGSAMISYGYSRITDEKGRF